jgi:hypothetical protein
VSKSDEEGDRGAAHRVQSRREERFVDYAIRPDTVSDLVRLLTACCRETRNAMSGPERAGEVPAAPAAPPVSIEVLSWVTKLVGGDGTGRRILHEPWTRESTVRSVLGALSARFPELREALWSGAELGEHIEVLVNDAVLGIDHTLDSPLLPDDRITLVGQYMGGAH